MAKIKNVESWGRSAATERYGKPEPTVGVVGKEDDEELQRLAARGLPDDPRAHNFEAPQHIGNQRGPKYSNNTSEKWLTGAVQATEKPGFDTGGGKKGK